MFPKIDPSRVFPKIDRVPVAGGDIAAGASPMKAVIDGHGKLACVWRERLYVCTLVKTRHYEERKGQGWGEEFVIYYVEVSKLRPLHLLYIELLCTYQEAC